MYRGGDPPPESIIAILYITFGQKCVPKFGLIDNVGFVKFANVSQLGFKTAIWRGTSLESAS